MNQRLGTWIELYHRTEHDGIGITPLLRGQRDTERIRQLPPSTDLRCLFFYRLYRLVRGDSTFRLDKTFYEAPAYLAGKKIEARFEPSDLVELYFQGEVQGLASF